MHMPSRVWFMSVVIAMLVGGSGVAVAGQLLSGEEVRQPDQSCQEATATRRAILAGLDERKSGEASYRNTQRSAAHLVTAAPTCFSAAEVALSRTLLDGPAPSAEDYRCEQVRQLRTSQMQVIDEAHKEAQASSGEAAQRADNRRIGAIYMEARTVVNNPACFEPSDIEFAQQMLARPDPRPVPGRG